MSKLIKGLHHVTAIASDAQPNVDFYTGVLGLRMIKKTVNFDAPEVYHFYFGNATGSPGTIITFFPHAGLQRGRRGTGQASFTAFSIPEGSVSYWLDRLTHLKVRHEGPAQRFNETVITLFDNDDLGLEPVSYTHLGSLSASMLMKMMLSMPNTTSKVMSVSRAIAISRNSMYEHT